MVSAETLITSVLADALRPPPRRKVSHWADAERILTRETSHEYGQWRTGRVPHTEEIMDSLSSSDPCELIVWMKCSQIAATEVGLNWIGYSIVEDPGPFLLVVPDEGFAKRYSKRRIRPMIAACPALRARVRDAKSRDSGNTTLQKDFDGGTLFLASSNSAAALSSDPVRRVMLDEVDRFAADVSGEGSPVMLAETRTTNFPNRKIYATSSPGPRSKSIIEPLFLRGDMRRYFVPCPECGHMDFITWRGNDPFKTDDVEHFKIVWSEDLPETAAMLCPACGCLIDERHKRWMFAKENGAQWRPTAKGDGYTRSYHTAGMYSAPGWLSWAKMAREWLAAVAELRRGATQLMQTFLNTRLGECWEEPGDKVEKRALLERAEKYPAQVPNGVGSLVVAVDTQDRWIEAQVVGFGAGEESWLIHWKRFDGDPDDDAIWFEVDEYLQRQWRHESGRLMRPDVAVVDSSGHKTQAVYRFCAPREDRPVFAIRGGRDVGKPLVMRPTRNNRLNALLFTLCVESGKDRVHSRMQITKPGPGYMHFPLAPWFDEEYVAQLTSEKKLPARRNGARSNAPRWEKTRDRNEAWDLTIYSLAALYILGESWVEQLGEEAERWARPLTDAEKTEAPAAPPATEELPTVQSDGFLVNPFRRTWVTDWRK